MNKEQREQYLMIVLTMFLALWGGLQVGRTFGFIPDPTSDELAEIRNFVDDLEADKQRRTKQLPPCTLVLIEERVNCTTQQYGDG